MRVIAAFCVVVSVSFSAAAETIWVEGGRSEFLAALKDATPGDILELGPGRYIGPFSIHKPVTIVGRGGVFDGASEGTTVTLEAPKITLQGLQIENSGDDLTGPDSCVYVSASAHGVVIRGNRLDACTFGIWLDQGSDSQIIGNRVSGRKDALAHERGNGIHLFNSKRVEVRGNHVSYTRDGLYVSVTQDSVLAENVFEYTRYGMHYMFAYANKIEENISRHNRSGYALMESHNLIVRGNIAHDNEDHGLLFRDAEDSIIEQNVLYNNGEGLFFFSSADNRIVGNVVRGNRVGAKVWAGSHRNLVEKNRFEGNERQIFYVSTKDLEWGLRPEEVSDERTRSLIEGGRGKGNYWSDYTGWDQDGDGIGDRPYRVDALSASLIYRFPAVKLLLRSPVLELLAHLQERMPVLRVPTVIDRRPLMSLEAKP